MGDIIVHKQDSVAGNANFDVVIPDNKKYKLLYAHVNLTTDATVANRFVEVAYIDEDADIIMDVHSGADIPASQSAQHHEFMQGIYRETSLVHAAIQCPIPSDWKAKQGWTVRASINTGKAGDSYNVRMVFEDITND